MGSLENSLKTNNDNIGILYISGRMPPPFNVGGDGVSAHTILNEGYKLNLNILAVGFINIHFFPALNTFEKIALELENLGIKIVARTDEYIEFMMPYRTRIYIDNSKLSKILDEISVDRVILFQLDLSREIMQYSISGNKPAILYIHDAEDNNFLTLNQIDRERENIQLVFNSEYTKNKFIGETSFVKYNVLGEPINIDSYKLQQYSPQFITLINPVKVKGGEIFLEMAKRLPKENFLAVEGWYDPLKEGLDFHNIGNITYFGKQKDIRKVLKITKLLLVPSQWEEGFGRVVSEAYCAKVPVLSSYLAGLKDSAGSKGMFVNKYDSAEEWINACQSLLSDSGLINMSTEYGFRYVQRFNAGDVTTRIVAIAKDLLRLSHF